MKRVGSQAIACVVCLSATSFGAEVYVSRQAAAPGQGTQASPFPTIQAGIDAAQSGDEVRVAGGSYGENIRVENKNIVLNGGFSAAWSRDVSANPTTIDGPGGNAVVTLVAADVTIDGFRITGGTGSTEQAPFGFHGGGIYCRDGSPTITNNIVEGNDLRSGPAPFDTNFGGGIYVSNAPNAIIRNNIIRNNVAGRGSGIFVTGPAVRIEGNTVQDNESVGDHGGGLFVAVVDARIINNTIRGNSVGRELGYGWGGGVIVAGRGNFAELAFNRVFDNFAAAYGSGEFIDEAASADIHHELIFRNRTKDGCEAVSAIAVDGGEDGGSDVTISHCTVVENVCETVTRGNGLQVEGGSIVSVVNSIFWNNGGDDFAVDNASSLTVTFTDSQEPIAGAGNISADPLFLNAATNDFRLSAGSPAIDAGDPTSPFNNEPAPNGGRVDMGRFGNAGNDPIDGLGTGNTGGNNNGGGNSNTNSGGNNNGGNGGNGGNDGPSGAGVCPSAAALMLSMSLVGLRRPRRR